MKYIFLCSIMSFQAGGEIKTVHYFVRSATQCDSFASPATSLPPDFEIIDYHTMSGRFRLHIVCGELVEDCKDMR